MKKALLISAVAAGFGASAQSFTADDTLYTGLTTNYYVMDSNAVSLSAITGPGVTWNYATLTAYEDATLLDEVIDAGDSPYTANFPMAAYNDDLSSGASIFFTNSDDSVTVNGYVFMADGSEVIVMHNANPLKAIVFPMTVGTTYSDVIVGEAEIMGNTFETSGNATVTCDGSGTLNVSGNTHSNVLRIKLVEVLNATFTIPFPPITVTGTVTRTVYSYYDMANDKQPIFVHGTVDVVSDALNDTYTAVYYSGTPNFVGVEDNKTTTSFSVYPNPSNTVATITSSGTAQSLSVINLAGQVVMTIAKPAVSETISLTGFEAGAYIVQLTENGVITEQKLIVE